MKSRACAQQTLPDSTRCSPGLSRMQRLTCLHWRSVKAKRIVGVEALCNTQSSSWKPGPAETPQMALHWVCGEMVCTSGIEQWGFGPRDPLRFPHMRLRLRTLRWQGVTFRLRLVSGPTNPSSGADSDKNQNLILMCSDAFHVVFLKRGAPESIYSHVELFLLMLMLEWFRDDLIL